MEKSNSVMIINSEAERLQKGIDKLKRENESLKEKLSVQQEAMKLCNKEEYAKVKDLVEKNISLTKDCEEKDEQLEIAKSIIGNGFETLKKLKEETKITLTELQFDLLKTIGIDLDGLQPVVKKVGFMKVAKDIQDDTKHKRSTKDSNTKK